jgi:hypothetical protein
MDRIMKNFKALAGDESGFNLVEVMLAAALLGTVLIAVIALFVLGGKNVKSGKELTKATALGMEMMEDFRSLKRSQSYIAIGGACGDTTVQWKSRAPSSSSPGVHYGIPGTPGTDIPDDCTFPASGWSGWPPGEEDAAEILCRWAINAREQFFGAANGTVSVKLDGFEDIPSTKNAARDGDTDICEARFLRVRVAVEWREYRRQRDVAFETLKF